MMSTPHDFDGILPPALSPPSLDIEAAGIKSEVWLQDSFDNSLPISTNTPEINERDEGWSMWMDANVKEPVTTTVAGGIKVEQVAPPPSPVRARIIPIEPPRSRRAAVTARQKMHEYTEDMTGDDDDDSCTDLDIELGVGGDGDGDDDVPVKRRHNKEDEVDDDILLDEYNGKRAQPGPNSGIMTRFLSPLPDASSRSPSASPGPGHTHRKRAKHNETEQRRRVILNHKLNQLRDLIPSCDRDTSKGDTVLAAYWYISELEKEVHRLAGHTGLSDFRTKFHKQSYKAVGSKSGGRKSKHITVPFG